MLLPTRYSTNLTYETGPQLHLSTSEKTKRGIPLGIPLAAGNYYIILFWLLATKTYETRDED